MLIMIRAGIRGNILMYGSVCLHYFLTVARFIFVVSAYMLSYFSNIPSLNLFFTEKIQQKIDTKTKPLGALGQLETLALQLALIQNQSTTKFQPKIGVLKPMMLVFAGDHGINEENVSIAPSAVTGQMVANFLHGGAAINCFCQVNNIPLNVVDCGILQAVEPMNEQQAEILVVQRLGSGTKNFTTQPAMSLEQVEQGLGYGTLLVDKYCSQGINILLLGEMGIANTSSASALMALLTELDIEQCVGVGTGISDEQYQRKIALIKQAILRTKINKPVADSNAILSCLTEVGGFEIVQMVGTILAAAKQQISVVIDGFIVTVAAFIACGLNPNVNDYLIFSHQSQEKGHQLLLTKMKANPLLHLSLRLGEGTGSALAFSLIQSAVSFYNNMASFESAGVDV
jgi:nicotinate-nucleotide--dimethylbenzimidazole phosphoribosyltransferase